MLNQSQKRGLPLAISRTFRVRRRPQSSSVRGYHILNFMGWARLSLLRGSISDKAPWLLVVKRKRNLVLGTKINATKLKLEGKLWLVGEFCPRVWISVIRLLASVWQPGAAASYFFHLSASTWTIRCPAAVLSSRSPTPYPCKGSSENVTTRFGSMDCILLSRSTSLAMNSGELRPVSSSFRNLSGSRSCEQ